MTATTTTASTTTNATTTITTTAAISTTTSTTTTTTNTTYTNTTTNIILVQNRCSIYTLTMYWRFTEHYSFSKTVDIPLKRILTSPAVLGLCLTHFSVVWVSYSTNTAIPLYLQDVLHFNIKKVS